MTQAQVGYQLIELASNTAVNTYGGTWGNCPAIPNPLILPDGSHVHAVTVNSEFGGYILIPLMMDEPPPAIPEEISDRQFFQQLAILEVITPAEALAAVKTGEIPSTIQAFIAQLPTEQQFNAEMLLSGATIFQRHHPMTLVLAQGLGWTEEQLDGLWLAASQL